MKKFFQRSFLAVAMLLTFIGCEKTEEIADMKISFEEESYSVEALDQVNIPFSVSNVSGDITPEVTSTNPQFSFTAVMSSANNGTILCIAPDVIVDDSDVIATLTVKNSDNSRVATADVVIKVTKSGDISLSFAEPNYTFVAEAGDVVTLEYEVSGLGEATVESVEAKTENGWSANVVKEVNKVELTVPAEGNSTDVTLTVVDNFGREATASTAVTLKEVVNYAERANCFLVAPGTMISFDASHRGNSDLAEDELISSSVELLWQDEQSLVESLSYDSDKKKVYVQLSEGLSGNAVVATRDSNGEINWSWHLWVTDYNPMERALYIKNFEEAMMSWVYMDRDLGATTDDWKSMDFIGLYYQWGRKDPFSRVNIHDTYDCTTKTIYDIDNNIVSCNFEDVANTDNLENGIKNPTTFYTNSDYNLGDWYTTDLATHNNDLWGGSADTHYKTIYDPCPAGWRIPENDYLSEAFPMVVQSYCGYFSQASGIDTDTYEEYFGGMLTLESGDEYFFPFSGRMSSTDGSITNADLFVGYWTANHYKSAANYGAYYFQVSDFFDTGGKCNTYERRGSGHAVRCVRIEE